MKNISILVPEGAQVSSIDAAHQLFAEANNYLIAEGKRPLFKVTLAGLTNRTVLKNGLFTIYPEKLIEDIRKTDLIIMPPAYCNDLVSTIELNKGYNQWIIKQYKAGAEVACLCIGAFLLGAAGILRGKRCSTNWMLVNEFMKMFPDVELVADKIITDENGVYSSGGGFSYMNLLIYIIEKYSNHDVAIHCSKVFQVDLDRTSQSPFLVFTGQKAHEDMAVKKAQEFMEANYFENINIEKIAAKASIGRRSLEMRFKSVTSNTINEYLQRVRIEAAKKLLERSQKNVNEVMYEVGYADAKAFRMLFKRITGLLPLAYRNKYYKKPATL